VHPRTVSPSLCSCPASDRASSFLPASALLDSPPRDLAIPRWARRAIRPIDFCHPYVIACTRTSCVPGSLPPLSERGRLTEFGLCAACPGNRVFHTTRNASADRAPTRFWIASRPFRCRRGSRAWALSSHGAGSTEPLTSLSPLPLPVRAHASSRVLDFRFARSPLRRRSLSRGPNRGGSRQGRLDHRPVKNDGS